MSQQSTAVSEMGGLLTHFVSNDGTKLEQSFLAILGLSRANYVNQEEAIKISSTAGTHLDSVGSTLDLMVLPPCSKHALTYIWLQNTWVPCRKQQSPPKWLLQLIILVESIIFSLEVMSIKSLPGALPQAAISIITVPQKSCS